MSNILTELQKKQEAGFDIISSDGEYLKSEKVKKEAFRDYNKGVASGEIDPLEYDFKSYYEWYTKSNFTSLNELVTAVLGIISGEYEITETKENAEEVIEQ